MVVEMTADGVNRIDEACADLPGLDARGELAHQLVPGALGHARVDAFVGDDFHVVLGHRHERGALEKQVPEP